VFAGFSAELGVGSQIARGLSESLVPRLRDVGAFLNACGATFLALDARALRPPASISAAASSGLEATGGIEEAANQDRLSGLLGLADSTGGAVVPGGPRVADRLRQARQGRKTAYLLAYPTPAGGSGEMRRVEVRLPAHKDLRVRHRRSFADVGGDSGLEQRLLAALQFGAGGDNPLEVRVEAGEPTRGEDGVLVVPIRVRVRLARLGMEPGEREHLGRLTLAIAARDERGRLSPVQRGEQRIAIPHERLLEALSGDAAYTFSVRVRSARQKLAVAVRDDLTRLISVSEIEVGPGA